MLQLPLDMPDDYPWLPSSVRYPLADLGELAVRLGSPVFFDRRGELVYVEDFSCGLGGWITDVSGDGASVKVDCDKPYRHPYQAKLIAGITLNKSASLGRTIGGWVTGQIGAEWMMEVEEDASYSRHVINVWDGSVLSQTALKYTDATKTWSVRNAAGGYTDVLVSGINIASGYMYIPVKFVFALDTGYYCRLLVGSRTVDLSSIALEQSADTDTPNLTIASYLYGTGSVAPIMRLAQILITANEP